MPRTSLPNQPGKLLFGSLGGTDSIGLNLSIYGYEGRWIIVDMGIGFGDYHTPGVDLTLPDISILEENRERIVGLVCTHAHEDHIGAIPYLWDELGCPIHATRFAAAMISEKLKEISLLRKPKIVTHEMNEPFHLESFGLRLLEMNHSIPEASALVIDTPGGKVFHTGDWKFDPDSNRYQTKRRRLTSAPDTSIEQTLSEVSDQGVLAMVCDSTNVMLNKRTVSESSAAANLLRVISQIKDGLVVATCFASNVARVEALFKAAQSSGRKVALVGRSVQRIYRVARQCGYLVDVDDPVDLRTALARRTPRSELLVIATGSQGEPRAALTRMARDDHRDLRLQPGDHIIFSSRIIPGNHVDVHAIQNAFWRKGINVITAEDHDIHSSGHGSREETEKLYEIIKPQILLAVHGEPRHLHHHVKVARSCGIPSTIIPQSGMIYTLDPQSPHSIDTIPTGTLLLDGNTLLPSTTTVVRDRRRLSTDGIVIITGFINPTETGTLQRKVNHAPSTRRRRHQKQNTPQIQNLDIQLIGLPDEELVPMQQALTDAVQQGCYAENHTPASNLNERIERMVRKVVIGEIDKRPIVHVRLHRL